MEYAALVLNYGQAQDTLNCLDSLFASTPPPCKVVVCDNGSHDGSLGALAAYADALAASGTIESYRLITRRESESLSPEELSARLVIVDNGANLGYAGGNNVGLSLLLRLGANYVWLLNNDTLVAPGAGGALCEFMRANPKVGLCGALTRYMSSPGTVQCYGGGWYNSVFGRGGLFGDGNELAQGRPAPEGPFKLAYVNGASVFASREFLLEVGLMEEGYFLYCEELDWAFRARGRFELGYCPKAEVLHLEGLSTGMSNQRGLRRSLLPMLRLARSRLVFTRKHCPWFLLSVLAGQFYAAFQKLCLMARHRLGR